MSDGVIIAGAVGRMKASTTSAASTVRIPAYVAGVMQTFTPDQMSSGATTISGARTYTGVQTYSAINLDKATNAITAFAGGGQSSATALTSTINTITVCATAADSVKLPTSVAGMRIIVNNAGAAYASVFPVTGDIIDALAANTSVSLPAGSSLTFTCTVAGTWKSSNVFIMPAKYTTGTTTTTFAAGQCTGAANVVYANTQGTPGSIAFRTAAQMFTDDPSARVGLTYLLTISNAQGTGTLTVTGGASGITLTGTATIAINTSRTFAVTYTSATALVIQNINIATFS